VRAVGIVQPFDQLVGSLRSEMARGRAGRLRTACYAKSRRRLIILELDDYVFQ
jgi:hypothetical protein